MRALGFGDAAVDAMQHDMRRDEGLRLKVHCKLELGIEAEWDAAEGALSQSVGSSDTAKSVLMMITAFSLGAAVPLLPWIPRSYAGLTPHVAVFASVVCSFCASVAAATIVARSFTPPNDHPRIIAAQVFAASAAVAVVYGVGLLYNQMGGALDAATDPS